MPLAREVAAELRKLADALDKEPEAVIEAPLVSMGSDDKEKFVNAVRLMPRPFTKKFNGPFDIFRDSIEINHETPALRVWAMAPRSVACRIVKPATPAEYECEPLLSQEERESLA